VPATDEVYLAVNVVLILADILADIELMDAFNISTVWAFD
jgi:hypothetical protein